eukprot:scaffold65187_cov67-Phaeocystis_antarctica.AAC.4
MLGRLGRGAGGSRTGISGAAVCMTGTCRVRCVQQRLARVMSSGKVGEPRAGCLRGLDHSAVRLSGGLAAQRAEDTMTAALRDVSSAFSCRETFLSRSPEPDQSQACQSKSLPCHRHRCPYFCCGTIAYAFAECRLAVVSGWVAITRSMPPTATALTFLEMLARFSLRRHRKANAYQAPGLFRDLRLLDEQRPPESRPYLTTRSYGSTKGPRSAHIGLGAAPSSADR